MTHDPRGGVFYIISGAPVHESDLTDNQRRKLGRVVPESPAPTTEPVPSPTVTTDA